MKSQPPASTALSGRTGAHLTSEVRGAILLVESDQAVGSLLALLLKRHGYQVLTARTAAEALKTWHSKMAGIDLLLTNTELPGSVKGLNLSRQLQLDKPQLRVVFTSNSRPKPQERASLIEGVNYIQNPCQPELFLRLIQQCFANTQRN
jgi:CheY-like chemotaxis protein